MLVGSLEIWDLSCPSLNRYWIHGKTSASVKLATDKKQSQYIGKKVFPTTTRQDCSLQRCAKKMRESGMQNTLPKYGRWNACQLVYLAFVTETWIACSMICAKCAEQKRKSLPQGKRKADWIAKQSARKVKRYTGKDIKTSLTWLSLQTGLLVSRNAQNARKWNAKIPASRENKGKLESTKQSVKFLSNLAHFQPLEIIIWKLKNLFSWFAKTA